LMKATFCLGQLLKCFTNCFDGTCHLGFVIVTFGWTGSVKVLEKTECMEMSEFGI
jgi:hypothetical protein